MSLEVRNNIAPGKDSIGASSSRRLIKSCTTGGSSSSSDGDGFESRLSNLILADDKAALRSLWPPLTATTTSATNGAANQRAVVTKLLHVCCAFDAVKCATSAVNGELGPAPLLNEVDGQSGMSPLHKAAAANAARCVEMLVSKSARTDQRTRDGNRLLPLEVSLARIRTDVTWNPDQISVEDLVVQLSEKDLKAVVFLCEHTKDIDVVVYKTAMGGHAVDLAILLVAAAKKVNELFFIDPESNHKATLYECVVKEAIGCGRHGTSSSATPKQSCDQSESQRAGKRKLLLSIVTLLQLFGVVGMTDSTAGKMGPPLIIRASKVGDEDVLDLLLKHNTDVNVTDEDGNSALHWCLRTWKGSSCPQRMKIMLLLLEHGARGNQKNNWGLTAAHFAAENGNSQAIQVLLLEDPTCINKKTEMKETPLYFAVKNDHKECVELLLRFGASTNIFNLRKQRPIDLAASQDMRFLLNQTHISPKNRSFFGPQKFSLLQGGKRKSPTWKEVYTSLNEDRASNSKNGSPTDEEAICKYYDSGSGCARGEKCFYLHADEFRRTKPAAACRTDQTSILRWNHVRRIFVGGLHRALDSDTLHKVFEEKFGYVEDARVMATQKGDMALSRGFGFVTFKDKKSVVAAVEAHHVTIMGRQVEIKTVVPKSFLLAELQQSLQQRLRKSDPDYAQQEKPKENTRDSNGLVNSKDISKEEETDNDAKEEDGTTVLKSWVDILRHEKQVKQLVPSSLPQIPEQSTPGWLGIFKNWLPGFLRRVTSGTEDYALSSLKSDFRAAFGMDLDHTSFGYSKLGSFIECFPDLCQLKFVPRGKGKPANHMILLPVPRMPTRGLFQSLTLPNSSSHISNAPVHDEDTCDNDESTKDHLLEVSTQEDESTDTCINMTQNVNRDLQGEIAASAGKYSRFTEFLKPDPIFHGRTWLQNACLKPRPAQQHTVLEFASREKNNHYQSTLFLREYNYYERYKACIRESRCFRCNLRRTLWANLPCRHLVWCTDCKTKATEAAGKFEHKCVVCDCVVQKIEILLLREFHHSNCQPISTGSSFFTRPWKLQHDLPLGTPPGLAAEQRFL